MRILVSGKFKHPFYEEAFCRCLSNLGHDVKINIWKENTPGKINYLLEKFNLDIKIRNGINNELIKKAIETKPEIIFLWRPTKIVAKTIIKLKEINKNAIIVTYNNDDPFVKGRFQDLPFFDRFLWKNYLDIIKTTDINLYYRKINIKESQNFGSKCSFLFQSYFIPERDYPRLSYNEKPRGFKIVYIGHFEDDGRDHKLLEIFNAGFDIEIYGDSTWKRSKFYKDLFKQPPTLLLNEDYSNKLSNSQIALCFLSKRNRDTYTRRCFEIPAHNCLLLSERSEDLEKFYKSDEEVMFFSNTNEMIEKLRKLKSDPELLRNITTAGYEKCQKSNFDIYSRVKELLYKIERYKNENQGS